MVFELRISWKTQTNQGVFLENLTSLCGKCGNCLSKFIYKLFEKKFDWNLRGGSREEAKPVKSYEWVDKSAQVSYILSSL